MISGFPGSHETWAKISLWGHCPYTVNSLIIKCITQLLCIEEAEELWTETQTCFSLICIFEESRISGTTSWCSFFASVPFSPHSCLPSGAKEGDTATAHNVIAFLACFHRNSADVPAPAAPGVHCWFHCASWCLRILHPTLNSSWVSQAVCHGWWPQLQSWQEYARK